MIFGIHGITFFSIKASCEQRTMCSKNRGQIKTILTSSQFTSYVQQKVQEQIQHQMYEFLLSYLDFTQFQTKISN